MSSNGNQIRFGTDGWRGIIAEDFTFANVRKVTRAIATYLKTAYSQDRPILIGYDTRFLADKFARTAAEILANLGWTVKIADRDCPTPVIAYHAYRFDSAGALMFTASHNPPFYCGIKYIPDYGGPATPDITDAIVANIDGSEGIPGVGSVGEESISTFDPQPEYLKFLYTQLDVERIRNAKLKVKYDALYSTSRGYLDTVLEHCGCEIQIFHNYRDVLFGGGMPQPTGEYLNELVEAVQQDRTDLGMATDGDGDRFGIVDEQGNILPPNTILVLIARHLIINKGKTGAIVRSVTTTHLLDRLAAKYGLELYETPVGFKYIGEKMRETNVLIGGEQSGGLSIQGHIPEKDGILANMLVAEAIAYTGKPLSQLALEAIEEAGGPVYYQQLDFHLPEEDKKTALMAAFMQNPPKEIAGIEVKHLDCKECVKFYLADGSWIVVRPSGTAEPLMRVYLETNSPEKKTKIAAAMERAICQEAAVAV